MKNKSLMVFLSCAIGSGIGVMLASQFKIYWWLGVLIGGFVGYLVYDFKQVITAIPIAFKEAKGEIKAFPFKDAGVLLVKWIVGIALILYPALVFSEVLAHSGHYLNPSSVSFMNSLSTPQVAPIVLSCMAVMYITMYVNGQTILLGFKAMKFSKGVAKSMKSAGTFTLFKFARKGVIQSIVVLVFAPIISVVLYLRFLLIGIRYVVPALFTFVVWLLKSVLQLIKFILTFGLKLLKLIHSDVRLLVGINSIVGGVVGHFSHNNILIAMIVGGVWGIISYQIFSIRIFKLKPKH